MNNSSQNNYPHQQDRIAIEEILQNSQRQFSQFNAGQGGAPGGPSGAGAVNGMPGAHQYIITTNNGSA